MHWNTKVQATLILFLIQNCLIMQQTLPHLATSPYPGFCYFTALTFRSFLQGGTYMYVAILHSTIIAYEKTALYRYQERFIFVFIINIQIRCRVGVI